MTFWKSFLLVFCLVSAYNSPTHYGRQWNCVTLQTFDDKEFNDSVPVLIMAKLFCAILLIQYVCIEHNHVKHVNNQLTWPFGTFSQKGIICKKLVIKINPAHYFTIVIYRFWLHYFISQCIIFAVSTIHASCIVDSILTSCFSFHLKQSRGPAHLKTASPFFSLALITALLMFFLFERHVPHAYVFL